MYLSYPLSQPSGHIIMTWPHLLRWPSVTVLLDLRALFKSPGHAVKAALGMSRFEALRLVYSEKFQHAVTPKTIRIRNAKGCPSPTPPPPEKKREPVMGIDSRLTTSKETEIQFVAKEYLAEVKVSRWRQGVTAGYFSTLTLPGGHIHTLYADE